MKIGVDGQLISSFRTGMGMVVYNVLKNWKEGKDIEVYLFVTEPLNREDYSFLAKKLINVIVLGKHNYLMWEQLVVPIAVKKYHIDVLWCPYNTAPIVPKCKVVLTIHDMIFMNTSILKTPSLYKKMGVLYRKLVAPIAIRKANVLTTVSHFSRAEIMKFFPNKKATVIWNAVDCTCNANCNEQKEYLLREGIKKKYILGMGSLEYRKNTMKIIRAYDDLPGSLREKYQLVLFGFRNFDKSCEKKYLNKEIERRDVIVLDYVTEKEKQILYLNSSIFVYPSLSEGFGLPILEAFSNNTPVITSCTSSMPEIAGNAALLVNPNKVQDIRDGIVELLINKNLRENLMQRGIERINDFSWEKTSLEYFKVFEKIL